MEYSPLSDLEIGVINTYERFSKLLGKVQKVEYEVKTKRSATGMMHVWIKPQHGLRHLGAKYPDEILIPKQTDQMENTIVIYDISSGSQKRFIKYLRRELPYINIIENMRAREV